ncbi:hypothetical protein K6U32_09670 [Vibrio diabolicus]|nr:winged-helix domain-containing protein [Vibrio diabolicus]MCG6237761.1 hypothetical protein [Vibrio diabolicus]
MKLNISAQSINSNNYEHIIPSRDVILSLFDKVKNHLSHEQISRSTGLDEKPQKDALKKRLRAMERDGQLIFTHRRGYKKVDQTALVLSLTTVMKKTFSYLNTNLLMCLMAISYWF